MRSFHSVPPPNSVGKCWDWDGKEMAFPLSLYLRSRDRARDKEAKEKGELE